MSRLNVDLFSADNPQREDRKIGILSYDQETKRLDFIGDQKQVMMNIIEFPEVGPPIIDFEDDPELFLSLLGKTYRGIGLRASDPYLSNEKPKLVSSDKVPRL